MENRKIPNRWLQLILAVIVMMSISSPQYTWTLFVKPIQSHLGLGLVGLQFTFSLLIILQTWFSPIQGYLTDKFGPRVLISVGSILTGLSWVLSSLVTNLAALYVSYGVLGGIGTGIIYVGIIGLVVQWFPDHRGLAAGLAAAGYGFGAIFTTFPITSLIQSIGYQQTLLIFGIIQGVIGLVAAQGLRAPGKAVSALLNSVRVVTAQSQTSQTPREMLKNPIFWVLFVMMSLLSTSGLMVTSEVGPFSHDFGVSNALVFGLSALPLSLTISRFTNGLTRPFFGWISDRIGRENTMLIAFLLEAAAIALLLVFRQNAVAFVLLTGVVFFGWGEIFSLFPTMLTDVFGTEYATTNYGFLYIAQGIGSLLGGPAAAYLESITGSWIPVFTMVACLDVVTALMAVLVLRPMCSRWFKQKRVGDSSVFEPVTQ